MVVDADSKIVLDGDFDVGAVGTGPDHLDNWSSVREVRCAEQRGDDGVLDFRDRPLDPRRRVFLPIDRSHRRVLDDTRKYDSIGNHEAVAGRGAQRRQANANVFDATFRYADSNVVTDAKRPLDQNVDPVDESAADILKGEADAERGGAENGGDRRPAGANNSEDDGRAEGVDRESRRPAQQGRDLGVDPSGGCGSREPRLPTQCAIPIVSRTRMRTWMTLAPVSAARGSSSPSADLTWSQNDATSTSRHLRNLSRGRGL